MSTTPPPDVVVTTPEAARRAGVSYRQLAYWISRGWVHGLPSIAGGGSRRGRPVMWGPSERLSITLMNALCKADISPARAAQIVADQVWEDWQSDEEPVGIVLSKGIVLIIDLEEL